LNARNELNATHSIQVQTDDLTLNGRQLYETRLYDASHVITVAEDNESHAIQNK
jgi:hypothetical protein